MAARRAGVSAEGDGGRQLDFGADPGCSVLVLGDGCQTAASQSGWLVILDLGNSTAWNLESLVIIGAALGWRVSSSRDADGTIGLATKVPVTSAHDLAIWRFGELEMWRKEDTRWPSAASTAVVVTRPLGLGM